MLEVADAVISVWGADRVAMHLAPRGDSHDMGDSDPAATFGYVARELGKRHIAFLCARESIRPGSPGPGTEAQLRRRLCRERSPHARHCGAASAGRRGRCRCVRQAVHRQPRSTPPLFALGAPLNAWNSDTFYSDGPAGYTDYPTLGEEAAAEEGSGRTHRLHGARIAQ